MAKYESAKFQFTSLDGRDYTVEFDRDSINKCARLTPFADDKTPAETASIVLWAGMLKHHEFTTLKRATEIVDAFLDEGYGTEQFADILDEYLAGYKATFSASETKKKAAIFSRTDKG